MKIKIATILTLVALICTGLIACTQPAVSPVEAGVLKSDKPRITTPELSGGAIEDLVSDNSTFAMDRILDTTVSILFVAALQMLSIGMIADIIDKRNKL